MGGAIAQEGVDRGIESLETLKVYIGIEKESWLKEYIQDVIIDLESE